MSRSRVTQAVGALLVCFTVASPLRAAEPSASAPRAAEGRVAHARGAEDPDNEPDENLPPAARAERAREQGHLGLAAFAERRWEAALDHFTRAERWMHSPVFLLYAARAQRELGQRDAARALFDRIVAEPLPDPAPPAWLDAQRSAQEELAELNAQEDGRDDGAGWQAAPPGYSAGDSPAGDSPVGNSAAGPSAASPGELTSAARGETASTSPSARPPAPFLTPDAPRPEFRTAAYAAFAVGALGLVTGGIAGAVAYDTARDIRSRCVDKRCLPEDEPKAYEARRWANVATAGFVVAATGAAAGVTLWLLPQSRNTPSVGVSIGPNAASLRGSF